MSIVRILSRESYTPVLVLQYMISKCFPGVLKSQFSVDSSMSTRRYSAVPGRHSTCTQKQNRRLPRMATWPLSRIQNSRNIKSELRTCSSRRQRSLFIPAYWYLYQLQVVRRQLVNRFSSSITLGRWWSGEW